MEERDILRDIQKTAIDSAYDKLWKARFVNLLYNPILEDNFCVKRRELRLEGNRSVVEDLAFSVETVRDFEQLLQEGQWVRPCKHSLGNPQMGISLFRHVDVALRFAKHMDCGSPVEVVVYKVVLGRPKMTHPRKCASDGFLDPTPNYDSHVSSIKPTNTDKIFDLLERSTVYLYEYDDQAFPVSHPRHCIPIAVVSFNNYTMPYLGSKLKYLQIARKNKTQREERKENQSGLKKDTHNEVKKDVRSDEKKITQSGERKTTQSGVKKDSQNSVKKDSQSGVKKDSQNSEKKDSQSGVKKDRQNSVKKDSQNSVKKDSQNSVKKDRQIIVKKDSRSGVKKDSQNIVKKDSQNIVKKDSQIGVKNDIQSGVKKDTQSGVKKDTNSDVKKGSQSEVKEKSQSIVVDDIPSEVNKENQIGEKKESHGDVKKDAQSGVKKDTQSVSKKESLVRVKKDALSGTKKENSQSGTVETKKESQGGFSKESRSEVKKKSENGVKKAPQIELKKKIQIVLKKETLSSVGTSSKSSETVSRKKKGDKDIIKKTHSLKIKNKKQPCDKKLSEESAITVSSKVNKTRTKTAVKESKNISCDFFKRLLQQEFLRRKSELLRRLSNSEIELDEDSRVLLETNVNFSCNYEDSDISELSTDTEDKLVALQNSTSVSDMENKETLPHTKDLELETFSTSEKKTVAHAVNSDSCAQHEINVETEQTLIEDVPDVHNRGESFVLNGHTMSSKKEQCAITEDILNGENKDKSCEQKGHTLSTEKEQCAIAKDILNEEDQDKLCELNRHALTSTEKEQCAIAEDIRNEEDKDKLCELNRHALTSNKKEKCAIPEDILNEEDQDTLVLQLNNNVVSHDPTQTCDRTNSEDNLEVPNGDTCEKNEIVQVKLTKVCNVNMDGCTQDRSANKYPREDRPALSIRNYSSSREHKHRRKVSHLHKSSKDNSWRTRIRHENKLHVSREKKSRTEARSKEKKQGQDTKEQDAPEELKTKKSQAAEDNSKLSPEAALNRLHDLLQQTGHCSIDFSTITDVLTGKILGKVSGNTAPETAVENNIQSIQDVLNVQDGDISSKLPNADIARTEITQSVESESNNVEQKVIAKECVEDEVLQRVINTTSSNNLVESEPCIKTQILVDPRLEAAKKQNRQITEILHLSPIDTTVLPTALNSAFKKDKENHTRTLKRVSEHDLKHKKKSKKPKYQRSESLPSLPCPTGTTPRVKCSRPLTCPFYSLVSSTFTWKVETIDLAKKPTKPDSELTTKDDGKPKFNGRTLLKGGVDPRFIPLEIKDSTLLKLVDPRRKKSIKTSEKVEFRCQASVTSESGSCISVTSVDSGLDDMDLCETSNNFIPGLDSNVVFRNQPIPTEGLDSVTKRITDLINDPKKKRPKQSFSIEGLPEISVNPETRHYKTASTKVESVTALKKEQVYCSMPERQSSDGCSSVSRTPSPSVEDSMGISLGGNFTVSGNESAPKERTCYADKTKYCQAETQVIVPGASSVLPTGMFPACNDSSLKERNMGVSQNGDPVSDVQTEQFAPGNFNQLLSFISSSRSDQTETFAKTGTSRDGVQHFDQGPQNSFISAPQSALISELSNSVRNSPNCIWQNNVNYSYLNPCFPTSSVFQPIAGECRTENYLANSPVAFSNFPTQPVSMTQHGQDLFDARQRINEIRCAKLISNQWIPMPENNYSTSLSQNCFNGMAGTKRPLSGAFDESNAKRFRSNIDFNEVLSRIQAAANVVTRLPPVMPRYNP